MDIWTRLLTKHTPEYFALALFGLSIIASVSGAIGMIVASVGIDSISGLTRFTLRLRCTMDSR